MSSEYRASASSRSPQDWGTQALGQLAVLERGKFSARPRNDPRFFGGDVPFIQTGDVRSGNRLITRFASSLNEAGVRVSKVFPAGTLFITIAANIGEVGVSAFRCACPDSLVAVHPRTGVHKQWLYYVLADSKRALESVATQNAQLNINLEKLNPFVLRVPPQVEQAAIAEHLGAADDLIDSLGRLVAKKRDMKQGVLRELLTGHTRLPGFGGDWTEQAYKEVIEIRKGSVAPGSPGAGVIPIIAGGKGPAGFASRANREGPVVTISASGSAGYVSMHRRPIWASDCSTIEAGPGFDLDFIYYSLVLRQEEIYRTQTRGAQPHVYPRDVYGISFKMPRNLDEQKAIAAVLRDADIEITALEHRLEAARRIKQGMMQQLLTGRTRLPVEGDAA